MSYLGTSYSLSFLVVGDGPKKGTFSNDHSGFITFLEVVLRHQLIGCHFSAAKCC